MYRLFVRFCGVSFMTILFNATVLAGDHLYVKSTATGSGDGSSWTDAMTSVQAAIDVAQPSDVICVAAGTYFPTHLQGGGEPRFATFYISKDILIYGGFSGEPGTEGDFESRDPKLNVTVLSGDLGVLGERSDNAYHVVYFDHVSDTARLDGFTITDGNNLDGEQPAGFHTYGAGIYNDANAGRSHPTIANCIIRDNRSRESGGGMMNLAQEGGRANPLILNCVFVANTSSGAGGIGYLAEGDGVVSPTLINCKIIGNTARTAQGSAMQFIVHSSVCAPKMINCAVYGNYASSGEAVNIFITGTGVSTPEIINSAFSGNSGASFRLSDIGSAQVSKITARNSIFFGNGTGAGISGGAVEPDLQFCLTQFFSFPGVGNIALTPEFVNPPPVPVDTAHEIGDLHLSENSPAIDAGSNAAFPAGTIVDADGKPRFINPDNGLAGTIDIGPYEVQDITSAIKDLLPQSVWNVFPNPTHDWLTVEFEPVKELGHTSVIDLQGRIITMQDLHAGQSIAIFNLMHFTPGMYFVYLHIDGLSSARQVTVK